MPVLVRPTIVTTVQTSLVLPLVTPTSVLIFISLVSTIPSPIIVSIHLALLASQGKIVLFLEDFPLYPRIFEIESFLHPILLTKA